MRRDHFFVIAFGLAVLFASAAAQAGGAIAGSAIRGPFALAAKQNFVLPACVPVTPPYDVYVATTGPATMAVRRYADKDCTYAIGIDAPLPTHILTQNAGCVAAGYCGDQLDLTPIVKAIRIIITDTSGLPNTVLVPWLTQDPPATGGRVEMVGPENR